MIPKPRPETSDRPNVRPLQGAEAENPVGARILALLAGRSHKWLAETAGLPGSTIGDAIKRGPARTEVAVRIADALSVSLDHLVTGRDGGTAPTVSMPDAAPGGSAEDEVRMVPILDLAVSAGPGAAAPDDVQSVGWVPFSRQMLAAYGAPRDLAMVPIRGDSMEPDLADGDLLMFSRARRDLADGLHVVRLDGDLLIKRVQVAGRYISLLSSNPRYPPIRIDREDEGRQFAIVGKAVWSGRAID